MGIKFFNKTQASFIPSLLMWFAHQFQPFSLWQEPGFNDAGTNIAVS